MNEKMKNLSDYLGFKCDEKNAWGIYGGYPFIIIENNINVSVNIIEGTGDVERFFEDSVKCNRIKNYRYEERMWVFTYEGMSDSEVKAFMDDFINVLKRVSAQPTCSACCDSSQVIFCNFDNTVVSVCDSCYFNTEQQLSENKNVRNNYLQGFIGAILGALLGGILWVIIGYLGYLASIAGYAITFLAIKGYTLFKGKLTRVTPFFIGLISIGMVIIAQFATLDVIIIKELGAPAIDVIKETFNWPFVGPEITSEFLKDTGIGILFAILGGYSVIKSIYKTAKVNNSRIERL